VRDSFVGGGHTVDVLVHLFGADDKKDSVGASEVRVCQL
jgi:hypothetical protein